jgi:hypothetical protein
MTERIGTGNLLSTSQNLRRGWAADPHPLSFGPTPPLVANAKIAWDQRSSKQWRRRPPLSRLDMTLILLSVVEASRLYPQIHPRMNAINDAQSQLGGRKGSTIFETFPNVLCSIGLGQCLRTNGFASRPAQANP